MGFWSKLINAARKRKAPHRDTDVYPRLVSLGRIFNQKAQIKTSPPNLRYFSRTVYARRAINILTNTISNLEWIITPIKGAELSKELERQIEIASNCFRHPNNDDNFASLLQQIIEDYCIFGAACVEQQLGTEELRPIWFWPVDAQSIQIYPGWAGGKNEARYLQTIGYSNVGVLTGKNLRSDEIIYIRSNPSTETPYGFGPIEISYATISRLLGTETFAGNLAANAQPQNMLWLGNISSDQLQSFRNYWKNEVEGQGGSPIVGTESAPVAVKLHAGTDDALYLKYQEFLIRTLAVAFGLSPQNFGIESDVNRSTAEVAEDRDWDQAIIPLATTIASYFTREALHKKLGFRQLKFEFIGLDRDDETETAKIYEINYKNNLLTPNEQREKLGLPKLEGQWGDMSFADMQIAISAARGSSQVDDAELSDKSNKKQVGNSSKNT